MRLLILIMLLFGLLALPAFATPSEQVTVGLDQLAGENEDTYYDRLFVQCGSWLPPYEDVKDAAKARLIELGAPVLPHLVPVWYASSNVRHRVTMEEIIRGIGPPAVDALLPYLNHDDSIMRQRIVTSLGDLDEPRVLLSLRAQLGTERDVQVLPALFDAIGKRGVGDASLIDAIGPHLTHADERVRRSGVVALGRIGSADAIPALLPLLDDALFSVRFPAREAIWTLAGATGYPPLPSVPGAVTPLGQALHVELDTALSICRGDRSLWCSRYAMPPDDGLTDRERLAILRGIHRAWQHDHASATLLLSLLKAPQSDAAVNAVRREILDAIQAQLLREAIVAP